MQSYKIFQNIVSRLKSQATFPKRLSQASSRLSLSLLLLLEKLD